MAGRTEGDRVCRRFVEEWEQIGLLPKGSLETGQPSQKTQEIIEHVLDKFFKLMTCANCGFLFQRAQQLGLDKQRVSSFIVSKKCLIYTTEVLSCMNCQSCTEVHGLVMGAS